MEHMAAADPRLHQSVAELPCLTTLILANSGPATSAWILSGTRGSPARSTSLVLGALALADIAMEFVADNQQYSFQTYKHTGVLTKGDWPSARIHWTPRDAKRGFVTRGLWAWSRHPNFFCEQAFWASPLTQASLRPR